MVKQRQLVLQQTMKSFLQNNNIEMYSTHNEGKMLLLNNSLEPILINQKAKLINTKCINTCHRKIKMKLVEVKSNTCINYSKDIIDKDTKFKIRDIVRISRYKKTFAKG